MTGDTAFTSFTKKRRLQSLPLAKTAVKQPNRQMVSNTSFRSLLQKVVDEQCKTMESRVPLEPQSRYVAQTKNGCDKVEVATNSTERTSTVMGHIGENIQNYGTSTLMLGKERYVQSEIEDHNVSVAEKQNNETATIQPKSRTEQHPTNTKLKCDGAASSQLNQAYTRSLVMAKRLSKSDISNILLPSQTPKAVGQAHTMTRTSSEQHSRHDRYMDGMSNTLARPLPTDRIMTTSTACKVGQPTAENGMFTQNKNRIGLTNNSRTNCRKNKELGLQQLMATFANKTNRGGKTSFKRSSFTNRKSDESQLTQDSMTNMSSFGDIYTEQNPRGNSFPYRRRSFCRDGSLKGETEKAWAVKEKINLSTAKRSVRSVPRSKSTDVPVTGTDPVSKVPLWQRPKSAMQEIDASKVENTKKCIRKDMPVKRLHLPKTNFPRTSPEITDKSKLLNQRQNLDLEEKMKAKMSVDTRYKNRWNAEPNNLVSGNNGLSQLKLTQTDNRNMQLYLDEISKKKRNELSDHGKKFVYQVFPRQNLRTTRVLYEKNYKERSSSHSPNQSPIRTSVARPSRDQGRRIVSNGPTKYRKEEHTSEQSSYAVHSSTNSLKSAVGHQDVKVSKLFSRQFETNVKRETRSPIPPSKIPQKNNLSPKHVSNRNETNQQTHQNSREMSKLKDLASSPPPRRNYYKKRSHSEVKPPKNNYKNGSPTSPAKMCFKQERKETRSSYVHGSERDHEHPSLKNSPRRSFDVENSETRHNSHRKCISGRNGDLEVRNLDKISPKTNKKFIFNSRFGEDTPIDLDVSVLRGKPMKNRRNSKKTIEETFREPRHAEEQNYGGGDIFRYLEPGCIDLEEKTHFSFLTEKYIPNTICGQTGLASSQMNKKNYFKDEHTTKDIGNVKCVPKTENWTRVEENICPKKIITENENACEETKIAGYDMSDKKKNVNVVKKVEKNKPSNDIGKNEDVKVANLKDKLPRTKQKPGMHSDRAQKRLGRKPGIGVVTPSTTLRTNTRISKANSFSRKLQDKLKKLRESSPKKRRAKDKSPEKVNKINSEELCGWMGDEEFEGFSLLVSKAELKIPTEVPVQNVAAKSEWKRKKKIAKRLSFENNCQRSQENGQDGNKAPQHRIDENRQLSTKTISPETDTTVRDSDKRHASKKQNPPKIPTSKNGVCKLQFSTRCQMEYSKPENQVFADICSKTDASFWEGQETSNDKVLVLREEKNDQLLMSGADTNNPNNENRQHLLTYKQHTCICGMDQRHPSNRHTNKENFDDVVSQLLVSSNQMAMRAMGLRQSINDLKLQSPKVQNMCSTVSVPKQTTNNTGCQLSSKIWTTLRNYSHYFMLLLFMGLQFLAQYVFVKR